MRLAEARCLFAKGVKDFCKFFEYESFARGMYWTALGQKLCVTLRRGANYACREGELGQIQEFFKGCLNKQNKEFCEFFNVNFIKGLSIEGLEYGALI